MTSNEEDQPAVNEDGQLSAQEDPVGDQPYKIPERRHVDALLDISEENFLKELEPHEYHCYPGWEEAVQSWVRVAPLSCILLTQKTYRKPKHKEADNPTPSSVDSAPSNADSSGSVAQQHRESHAGLHNLKKSRSLNQQTGSWSQPAVAAQQPDLAEWPVLSAVQRNTAHFILEDKIEEEGMLGETPLQPHHLSSEYSVWVNRPTKPQKHSHRSNYTTVPIKNFMFLPPIKSPKLNSKVSDHLCRCKKAPEGGNLEENCFLLDKKSGTRRTRVDTVVNSDLPTYSAALGSKHQTCQHHPQFFSAASANGKSLSQAIAQPHVHPSSLLSYGTRLCEMSSCMRPVK